MIGGLLFSFFTLLGGLAFFIFGKNQLSHALERIAGDKMERIINTMTKNRFVGLVLGCIITIAIQSSSAVTVMLVGMLQALSMTGGITYAMAFPIIMGQNIGTCATAILSSIGVSKNAKRVAAIHLSFNLIGTAIFMFLYFGALTFAAIFKPACKDCDYSN